VLPSSALMLSVPAGLAGCKTIVLATPPRQDGSISPEVTNQGLMCPTTLHMTQNHPCSPDCLVFQSCSPFCIGCVRALLRSDTPLTWTEQSHELSVRLVVTSAGPVLRKESGGDPCTAGRRSTGGGRHGLGHSYLPKGSCDTAEAGGVCLLVCGTYGSAFLLCDCCIWEVRGLRSNWWCIGRWTRYWGRATSTSRLPRCCCRTARPWCPWTCPPAPPR
jgi:Histidinol dehydrogenase